MLVLVLYNCAATVSSNTAHCRASWRPQNTRKRQTTAHAAAMPRPTNSLPLRGALTAAPRISTAQTSGTGWGICRRTRKHVTGMGKRVTGRALPSAHNAARPPPMPVPAQRGTTAPATVRPWGRAQGEVSCLVRRAGSHGCCRGGPSEIANVFAKPRTRVEIANVSGAFGWHHSNPPESHKVARQRERENERERERERKNIRKVTRELQQSAVQRDRERQTERERERERDLLTLALFRHWMCLERRAML